MIIIAKKLPVAIPVSDFIENPVIVAFKIKNIVKRGRITNKAIFSVFLSKGSLAII